MASRFDAHGSLSAICATPSASSSRPHEAHMIASCLRTLRLLHSLMRGGPSPREHGNKGGLPAVRLGKLFTLSKQVQYLGPLWRGNKRKKQTYRGARVSSRGQRDPLQWIR